MSKNKFLITLFVAVAIFSSCKENKQETTDKVIPVKVTEITAAQTASVKNYVGTVEESVAISLSFSLMGTVEEVFVQEGQRVSKGQLLATLNTTTAENSYQGSLAKLRQAQDAYDRLAKVYNSGSLPDIKFVEVETGLQQAKSMAAVAKKNLDDCKLYAPRDGIIATRSIEVGGNVNLVTEVFKLVSIDKVLVKIPVPENEIGDITEGQAASVVVAALDNAVFRGKVEIKGVDANAISHTYEAKIAINNPRYQLMPGMVCKVSLAGRSGASDIVVPNRTVQISADGKRYVWLANNGIAQRQFVEIGDLTNNGIVITDGLSAGDHLITEGFLKISEGTKISIKE